MATLQISLKSICDQESKNTLPWKHVLNDHSDEVILGTFCEKESKKTSQKEFRIEKVIKRKGQTLSQMEGLCYITHSVIGLI